MVGVVSGEGGRVGAGRCGGRGITPNNNNWETQWAWGVCRRWVAGRVVGGGVGKFCTGGGPPPSPRLAQMSIPKRVSGPSASPPLQKCVCFYVCKGGLHTVCMCVCTMSASHNVKWGQCVCVCVCFLFSKVCHNKIIRQHKMWLHRVCACVCACVVKQMPHPSIITRGRREKDACHRDGREEKEEMP